MSVLLTDKELMETAKVPPEDYAVPPHWWLRANQRVAEAQVKKVAHWIENLPTDGMDKWFFYHKELAERLLKECE